MRVNRLESNKNSVLLRSYLQDKIHNTSYASFPPPQPSTEYNCLFFLFQSTVHITLRSGSQPFLIFPSSGTALRTEISSYRWSCHKKPQPQLAGRVEGWTFVRHLWHRKLPLTNLMVHLWGAWLVSVRIRPVTTRASNAYWNLLQRMRNTFKTIRVLMEVSGISKSVSGRMLLTFLLSGQVTQ